MGSPTFPGVWTSDEVDPRRPNATRNPYDATPSRRMINVGVDLPGGLPYQPWLAALVNERTADNAKDDPHVRCLHANFLRAYGMPHLLKFVPKMDLLVSAIVRLRPNAQPGGDVATNGASRCANYRLNAPAFLAATGRPLRPGVTQETVNLLGQGDLYGERVNTFDTRFAKVLRFGRTRTNVGVDLYNVFNSNTPTAYEAIYDVINADASFQPTSIVQPRFVRFNVQLDFCYGKTVSS